MPGLLVQDTVLHPSSAGRGGSPRITPVSPIGEETMAYQHITEASEAQELTQIATEDLLFLRWRNRQGVDAGDGLPGVAFAVLAGVRCVRAEQDMVRSIKGTAGQHAAYGPLDRRVDVEH